jgi:hypothetical protein
MRATTDVRLGPVGRVRLSWNQIGAPWRWAVTLYVGYQALFLFWCAWVSSVFPKFVEEARTPVWPPSSSLGVWLERVVLLPQLRYDAIWYVGIAEQGYAYREGSTTFHPLLPLLGGVLGRLLGGHYLLGVWLVAQICCVGMLVLLYRLVLLDHDEGTAQRATLFLIGGPVGFTFLLPYTESLLLLSVLGALYAARTGRWLVAGLAGAAAALTKQPGALVILPLLWELWSNHRGALRNGQLRALLRPALGVALVPLGLLCWLVYRASIGDVRLDPTDPVAFLTGVLVSPDYREIHRHTFGPPWQSVLDAVIHFRATPTFYVLLHLFLGLIAAVLILYAALRTRASYAIFSLMMMVLSFTVIYQMWPLLSILRRLTAIFPLWIQLGAWGRSRVVTLIVLLINALLWALLAAAYVRNAYIL